MDILTDRFKKALSDASAALGRFTLAAHTAAPAKEEPLPSAQTLRAQEDADIERGIGAREMAKDYGATYIEPAKGEKGAQLNAMVDELMAKISSALPEVKNIPPRPKIYIHNGPEIGAGSNLVIGEGGKDTTHVYSLAIIISEETLKRLSPAEIKTVLGHELGHPIAEMNPELVSKFIPPNPAAVAADIQAQKIAPEQLAAYKKELFADFIGTVLTRTPEIATNALKQAKAFNDALQQKKRALEDNENAAAYSQALKRPITAAERESFTSAVRKTMEENAPVNENPHPSIEVRNEAMVSENRALQEKDLILPAARAAGAPYKGK